MAVSGKKVEAFEDISGVVFVLETLLSGCFGPDGISFTPIALHGWKGTMHPCD